MPYHQSTGPDVESWLDQKAPLASPVFSGSVAFPAGSSALPGLHPAGDPDTGIGQVAPDTLVFSTAGTARVQIAAAGQVGIGTATPAEPLTVYSETAEAVRFSRPAHDEYSLHITSSRGLHVRNVTRNRYEMVFIGDGSVSFSGGVGGESLRTALVANGVNRVAISAGVAGSPPKIASLGADTNIDLLLECRGTGRLRFGNYTSTADAPIVGHIEIRDAAGTIRKLAVIA